MKNKAIFEKEVRAKVNAINAKIHALAQETQDLNKSTLKLLDKVDRIKENQQVG
jgi:uncharacterized coiled-coil DUF342 family protein